MRFISFSYLCDRNNGTLLPQNWMKNCRLMGPFFMRLDVNDEREKLLLSFVREELLIFFATIQ